MSGLKTDVRPLRQLTNFTTSAAFIWHSVQSLTFWCSDDVITFSLPDHALGPVSTK